MCVIWYLLYPLVLLLHSEQHGSHFCVVYQKQSQFILLLNATWRIHGNALVNKSAIYLLKPWVITTNAKFDPGNWNPIGFWHDFPRCVIQMGLSVKNTGIVLNRIRWYQVITLTDRAMDFTYLSLIFSAAIVYQAWGKYESQKKLTVVQWVAIIFTLRIEFIFAVA